MTTPHDAYKTSGTEYLVKFYMLQYLQMLYQKENKKFDATYPKKFLE